MEYEKKNLIVIMGQFVNENGQMQTLEDLKVRFARENCEIEICDGIPEQSADNKLILNYETLDEIVTRFPEEKHKIKIYERVPEEYPVEDDFEGIILDDIGEGKVQRPAPWPDPPDDDTIV